MTAALLSHFPVPVLESAPGQLPYRRSWFVEQTTGGVNLLRMRNILAHLNPGRLVRLPDHETRTVYRALLDELASRFPINEFVYLQAAEEWDEDDMLYASDRIPVEVQGVNVYEEQLDAPFVVCFALLRPVEIDDLRHQESIDAHRVWLTPLVSAVKPRDKEQIVRPPRGRAWRKAWASLPDLCNYCVGNTGYGLLDYDRYSMSENGWDSYPALNLAEIRGLERNWKTVKPILERIHKLAAYIERGGTPRLQLVARAVSGDAVALCELTEPKTRAGIDPAHRFRGA